MMGRAPLATFMSVVVWAHDASLPLQRSIVRTNPTRNRGHQKPAACRQLGLEREFRFLQVSYLAAPVHFFWRRRPMVTALTT